MRQGRLAGLARTARSGDSQRHGSEPLPSTLGPFDWSVMPSGTDRYWRLAWALLAEQTGRLAHDGIAPRDEHSVEAGTCWTPAVDLALGDASSFAWFDAEQFVPARPVWAVAAGNAAERLRRGTVLRLESVLPDRYHEGMGVNAWSVDTADLDVPFLHSALEGRWGGAAVLADRLIVPLDHPIVGDDKRADGLVRDLQDITRAFRDANGLPPDGDSPSPAAAPSGPGSTNRP